MTTSTVLVVGGEAIDAGLGSSVVELARRTRTGVLNTWRAKGLFRFDDPAHLGTIGLQRNDLVLAGVAGAQRSFERIVVCGVADGELPAGLAEGLPPDADVLAPDDLAAVVLDVHERWGPRPPLYDLLAEVCGPVYGATDLPLSPIRAAGDLAAWLPPGAVVTAGAGEVGFWLGRVFPTRAPATVRLPLTPDPRFVADPMAEVAGGVVVVLGPDDPVPDGMADVGSVGVVGPPPWVVVERWTPHGPRHGPTERLARLDDARRRGGVEICEVGVALGDLGALEAVAGPVVVWGGPESGWSG